MNDFFKDFMKILSRKVIGHEATIDILCQLKMLLEMGLIGGDIDMGVEHLLEVVAKVHVDLPDYLSLAIELVQHQRKSPLIEPLE